MKFQQFLLLKLMEECAEVQQRASKYMQFGQGEIEPGGKHTNEERLRFEINDLLSIIRLLEKGKIIPTPTKRDLENHILTKEMKVIYYANYSKNLGMIQKDV